VFLAQKPSEEANKNLWESTDDDRRRHVTLKGQLGHDPYAYGPISHAYFETECKQSA